MQTECLAKGVKVQSIKVGTVYKGMLLYGRVIAIKKKKKVDESQLHHFVGEVAILSQVNRQNVVKWDAV